MVVATGLEVERIELVVFAVDGSDVDFVVGVANENFVLSLHERAK